MGGQCDICRHLVISVLLNQSYGLFHLPNAASVIIMLSSEGKSVLLTVALNGRSSL